MGTRAARATLIVPLVVAAAVASGCGADEAQSPAAEPHAPATTGETTAAEDPTPDDDDAAGSGGGAAAAAKRPSGEEGLRVAATRARIVARGSEFGRVLFDANGQVVYAFERDGTNRSNCTSAECVKAWPPVLTKEKPSPGTGVVARLLGTIRRADGSLQVTYNGRPLYFYEHEGPGEIKCHNVDLHGGLWWVITPQGDPAA